MKFCPICKEEYYDLVEFCDTRKVELVKKEKNVEVRIDVEKQLNHEILPD